MKKLFTLLIILFALNNLVDAQCTFPGTNFDGTPYSVSLELTPVDVIVTNCFEPGGFTYQTVIDFDISFTGTPPNSLFTFQGNINCSGTNSFFNLPNQGVNATGQTTAANASTVPANNGPCADASPDTLGCGMATIQINGPGVNMGNTPCPLTIATPIKLTSFTAESDERNQVVLQWVTESEVDNDFFTLEYSKDGENWFKLGNVKGQGNSSTPTSYEFVDVFPASENILYRLMQTDFDGSRTFSDIRQVMIEELKDGIITFPNPAIEFVTLQARENIEIFSIVDINGDRYPIFINSLTDRELQLDVSTLSPGYYFVDTNQGATKIYVQ